MSHMELTIGSEDDAWKIIKDTMAGTIELDHFDFTFDNWPVLEIKLKGEQFQSSMTTKVMESFIELQRDIYRAYAKLRYNIPNANLLSAEERQSLEIIVKVSEGSSELEVSLTKAIVTFAKEAANKMESKHIVAVVLGAGLLWTGNAAWNNYLDTQVEIKQLEIQAFSDEEETKRMKVLKEIIAERPVLQTIQEDSKVTYNKFFKNTARAESILIAGKEIPQKTVKEIAKTVREIPKEIRLDGACKIRKVDSSKLGVFVVHVEYLPDGRTFAAEINEDFLATRDKFKRLIREAEWDKKPVQLTMNCREKRGEVTQATILGVEKITE
ncbi:MAG: hypothetical protein KAT62_00545 [Desulfuromonadales bacterium]|nr:hypothetical protein [Desulfuromonadales bacterium]